MQVQGSAHQKRYTESPLPLYRAALLNPSPYMYYYHFGDFHVVGIARNLVRQEQTDLGQKVTIRLAGGTRPRAASPEADKAVEIESTTPKERAEHVMLIDLARNDMAASPKPAA
jgi:anthranilate synthase component 1